jgi:aspartyl-tRNA synthetase
MPAKRTHHCGALRAADTAKPVRLCGWVHRRRDHGGLIFIDLRDRWGLTQVVFNPAAGEDLHGRAKELRSEFCVAVEGTVQKRPAGTENPKIPTGEIEVVAARMDLLNASATPPFEIAGDAEVSEELRYTYRYLDLRRPELRDRLLLRHKVLKVIRKVLDGEEFTELETPVLTKSTPEGARDYLVPSRLNRGSFFALPQSPQLYKQLLMVAGFDRYYQIARCFRDEDLRADRQPEFTQLDIEMSFVDEEMIYALIEKIFAAIGKEALGKDLALPFPRLTYAGCSGRFGSDKPDLRYGMELLDLTRSFDGTGFERFREAIAKGSVVRGLVAPGAGGMTGKQVDGLTELAKQSGALGLVTIRVTEKELVCPVAKHLGKEMMKRIVADAKAKVGDLILMVADEAGRAGLILSGLRGHLAEQLKLIPEGKFAFAWVTDFPLFKWNAETKRWDSEHHPFTAPNEEDKAMLESDPGKVRSRSYDLALNGVELGSGSIRIHDRQTQEAVFRVLGLPEQEVKERFGFLLDAFRYGAPPHGGIAPGVDRLIALITGEPSIREVIAFPKTQKAVDLMVGAPSEANPDQLKELGITVKR